MKKRQSSPFVRGTFRNQKEKIESAAHYSANPATQIVHSSSPFLNHVRHISDGEKSSLSASFSPELEL